MRRERKEIIQRMYDLAVMSEIDRQLGCGYTASDFGFEDPYDKENELLIEKLAATYGMTASEYLNMEMEVGAMLVRNFANI